MYTIYYRECGVGVDAVRWRWEVDLLVALLAVVPRVREAAVGVAVVRLQLVNDLSDDKR